MTKRLTFLAMKFVAHPLLAPNTFFSLLADQRVLTDQSDSLTQLIGRNWVNQITTLVGKNATGKTTIMKLIMGTLSLLLQNKSISQTKLTEVLMGDDPIKIETYFYGEDRRLYQDALTIALQAGEWAITDEVIAEKTVAETVTKKKLLDFDHAKVIQNRAQLDETVASILAVDDSLFRSVIRLNQYQVPPILDTLFFTDYNTLIYNQEEVPAAILAYLDPTIEYLKIATTADDDYYYRLKFKGHQQEITDKNFMTISMYLSSGTAKGVTLYAQVLSALQTGGIIFIDELENHFNHAIARTFMEYFTNPKINLNHATLIFSTHYAEFLDEIDRNDQVYIARRPDKMTLTRYSETDMRSDISKAEVFLADNLGGTSPSYNAYIALKRATIKAVQNND